MSCSSTNERGFLFVKEKVLGKNRETIINRASISGMLWCDDEVDTKDNTLYIWAGGFHEDEYFMFKGLNQNDWATICRWMRGEVDMIYVSVDV